MSQLFLPIYTNLSEIDDGREWRMELCQCTENTDTCLPSILPCVGGSIIVEVSIAWGYSRGNSRFELKIFLEHGRTGYIIDLLWRSGEFANKVPSSVWNCRRRMRRLLTLSLLLLLRCLSDGQWDSVDRTGRMNQSQTCKRYTTAKHNTISIFESNVSLSKHCEISAFLYNLFAFVNKLDKIWEMAGKLELIYFDLQGRAAIPRMLLALADWWFLASCFWNSLVLQWLQGYKNRAQSRCLGGSEARIWSGCPRFSPSHEVEWPGFLSNWSYYRMGCLKSRYSTRWSDRAHASENDWRNNQRSRAKISPGQWFVLSFSANFDFINCSIRCRCPNLLKSWATIS